MYASHWDGHHWQTITAPANLLTDSTDIVPDGRGGYWFGPFADWTGHAWVNHLYISPQFYGGGLWDVTRIPGTSSFFAAAGITSEGSSAQYPAIYRLDLG